MSGSLAVRIIEARERSVGGLPVLRPLPTREQRSVGPFVFLDELGPVVLEEGRGLDVRPHPHIGLSTLTYRLSGELVHRDSMGFTQVIRPGEVNWMTAGRGVTHSERSADSERGPACTVHGVQLWVALEGECEEVEPSFSHHGAESLPRPRVGPVEVRLIAGEAFGERSPVRTYSPLFCFEAVWLEEGEAELELPGERAGYPLLGEFRVGGTAVERGRLAVFERDTVVRVAAKEGTRVLFLGGAPRKSPLHMHWNYVSSSPSKLAEARRRWADRGFPPVVGDADTWEEDPTPPPS